MSQGSMLNSFLKYIIMRVCERPSKGPGSSKSRAARRRLPHEPRHKFLAPGARLCQSGYAETDAEGPGAVRTQEGEKKWNSGAAREQDALPIYNAIEDSRAGHMESRQLPVRGFPHRNSEN
jgi:hypothetical protein